MNCAMIVCWRCQKNWKPLSAALFQLRCHTVVANSKAVKKTVNKFLIKNKNLKKLADSAEEFSEHLVPLVSSKKPTKKLSHGMIMREKSIANKLRNEIQDLIDTGALGSEMQELNIKFSKSTMASSDVCRIMWDPYCSQMDLKVSELLNSASKRIRYMLMTNHVMGNVPELYFYIDDILMQQVKVEKLFQEGKVELSPEPVKQAEEKAPDDVAENDPLFGLDYEEMYAKLITLKKTNRVDKG